jgi:hypothetical protein
VNRKHRHGTACCAGSDALGPAGEEFWTPVGVHDRPGASLECLQRVAESNAVAIDYLESVGPIGELLPHSESLPVGYRIMKHRTNGFVPLVRSRLVQPNDLQLLILALLPHHFLFAASTTSHGEFVLVPAGIGA